MSVGVPEAPLDVLADAMWMPPFADSTSDLQRGSMLGAWKTIPRALAPFETVFVVSKRIHRSTPALIQNSSMLCQEGILHQTRGGSEMSCV